MRKDKTFSDRKLTAAEFSEKYWLDGEAVHQYHTMEIEDGGDEREQLIINNIRALYERFKFYDDYFYTPLRERVKKLEERLEALTPTPTEWSDEAKANFAEMDRFLSLTEEERLKE